MLNILKQLKDNHGVVAVKAEFEAEGTRSDEFLRLLEITRRAGLDVALKIGGAEAIRDLFEAKQFGADYVVAPMVETPYALSKYIGAYETAFTKDELEDTSFLFNVETKTTFNNLAQIIDVIVSSATKPGIVFGRVDFTQSNGMKRGDVNSDKILEYCLEVARQCKLAGIDFVVGGGVSLDAIDFLQALKATYLTRFETRKIIFNADALSMAKLRKGLLLAVEFELLWLQNKHNYYACIAKEDETRLELLSTRVLQLRQEVG